MASVPGVASADWQLAPFLGLTFKGSTTLLDPENGAGTTHWSLGGTVTYIGKGPLGAEGIFIYTPGFFENKNPSDLAETPPVTIVNSRTMALMGNMVLTIPKSWNEYGLRPFLSGGLGLLFASSTDSFSLLPVKKTLLGYDVGGGAIGLLNERIGLRFD